MEVPHNKTDRPLEHYREMLVEADAEALSLKSGVAYDADAACFHITFLGRALSLSFPGGIATWDDTGEEASTDVTILSMRIVLEGTLTLSRGEFIPYVQIPWGQVYIGPFTGRCLTRLAYMFKTADDFCAAAERIGGKAFKSSADGSYEFEFVPGIFVQAFFWEGDEEFQPRTQMLFSDNVSLAFTAEDVAVLGGVLDTALKRGGVS